MTSRFLERPPTAVPCSWQDRLERFLASPWCWGLLLALGLAVRCRQYLFVNSYWYDESFLVIPVREHSFGELLGPQPYHLVSPPLFLWLTRSLFELGGDGELVMRLPAFLAGCAALFAMMALARKVVGGTHAVWALALLVVGRHALLHSAEAHPYTMDMLLVTGILLATTCLLDPGVSRRTRLAAMGMLALLAVIGPWLSFPSAFALGGASFALAIALYRDGSRRAWLGWLGFNGIVAFSGAAMWWISGRHMYYPGMLEHWGPHGWNGFPDWHNPGAAIAWLLWRPCVIANYGTRELGPLVVLLAILGGVALARRSAALAALLVTPFVLAFVAAILGKYPLADRTVFFLLPCLWLLAACGIASVAAWGRTHGRQLAWVGFAVIAWDLVWVGVRLVHPDARIDYRGAYEYVHAHREPDDLLWAQMTVVYHTYYGKDAPVLNDRQFKAAIEHAKSRRVWTVWGETRADLRRQFEAAGTRIVHRHHVSGLEILAFEPSGKVSAW